MLRPLSAIAGLSLAVASIAVSAAEAKDLAFVGCPIVRDTKTVPCWLAEYEGELYFLGIQTDVSAEFHPPSLGHEVLVEGTVSDEPRICGGKVLKPVKVSVMQERADNCNTLLMAEDRYELPFEPPRPPGPSKGRLAFAYPQPELPKPPFQAKSFEIDYDFDGMVGFKHPRYLVLVLNYAQHIGAKRIEITGYRAATRLSNGQILAERDGIAEQRAKQVAELLRGAGLTAQEYQVKWVNRPETGGPEKRRVRVLVSP